MFNIKTISYGEPFNRSNYICKSEINKKLLHEMHLDKFSVKEVKETFEEMFRSNKLDNYFVWVQLGMPYNENYRKRVLFLYKPALYHYVVKGF